MTLHCFDPPFIANATQCRRSTVLCPCFALPLHWFALPLLRFAFAAQCHRHAMLRFCGAFLFIASALLSTTMPSRFLGLLCLCLSILCQRVDTITAGIAVSVDAGSDRRGDVVSVFPKFMYSGRGSRAAPFDDAVPGRQFATFFQFG